MGRAGSALIQTAAAVAVTLATQSCRSPAACVGVACGAACPRDSRVGADGRCACEAGTAAVLGACVPPRVADAYCGPGAHATGAGQTCAFPPCGNGEVADVDAGCVDLVGVARGGPKSCAGGTLVVEGRRFACVPADAACPQGSRAAAGAGDGGAAICEHRPSCPPGSLEAGGACRPVVLRSARGREPVVDVGAWAALVLGADGGPGSPDLCRPLQTHPFEVGLAPGESLELSLRIGLRVPDQDVAAVHARVGLETVTRSRPVPPGAAALAERAVAALVEPLRGLGGQASASSVELELRCNVASL